MSSRPPAHPSTFCRRVDTDGRRESIPSLLESSADALEVIAAALHVPERFETIALLLDDDRRGRTIVVVDGTTPADSIVEVVECLSDTLAPVGGGHLVVASVRPGVGLLPGDSDLWLESSDIADERGCTLIEWFIISDRLACSVPDLLAEPPRW